MHLHAIICQVLYYVFCGILYIIVSQKISVHAVSDLDKETKRNPWVQDPSYIHPHITRTLNISPSIIKPLHGSICKTIVLDTCGSSPAASKNLFVSIGDVSCLQTKFNDGPVLQHVH